MLDERCANRVISGAGLGAAVGAAVGSAYGSWEAVNYVRPPDPRVAAIAPSFTPDPIVVSRARRVVSSLLLLLLLLLLLRRRPPTRLIRLFPRASIDQIPGFAYKIRHVGRTTLGSAALFGLFLGAGVAAPVRAAGDDAASLIRSGEAAGLINHALSLQ